MRTRQWLLWVVIAVAVGFSALWWWTSTSVSSGEATTVEVVAADYVPREQVFDFPESGELQQDIRLEKGGRLEGTVLNAGTHNPVPQARVQVEGLFTELALSPSFDALTDAQGRFAIAGIPPAGVTLLVTAPGFNGRLFPGAKPGAPLTLELSPPDPDAGTKLELVGIGAVLAARGDALVLGTVMPGGGASEVGLQPGDGIISVDGAAVVDLGFAGAVQRIRGPEGSTVRLGIRKAGTKEVVELQVPRKKLSA